METQKNARNEKVVGMSGYVADKKSKLRVWDVHKHLGEHLPFPNFIELFHWASASVPSPKVNVTQRITNIISHTLKPWKSSKCEIDSKIQSDPDQNSCQVCGPDLKTPLASSSSVICFPRDWIPWSLTHAHPSGNAHFQARNHKRLSESLVDRTAHELCWLICPAVQKQLVLLRREKGKRPKLRGNWKQRNQSFDLIYEQSGPRIAEPFEVQFLIIWLHDLALLAFKTF